MVGEEKSDVSLVHAVTVSSSASPSRVPVSPPLPVSLLVGHVVP